MIRLLLLAFPMSFLIACSPTEASKTTYAPVDKTQATQEINRLMDNWHHAAAVADEDTYFGSMQEDAIYLGTDKTERWEKAVFEEWSSTYFQRDTAWAFTAHDRVIYYAKNSRTAWFEELLDTWMGPCRGSGVLTLNQGNWKIAHYNLAMLIDNDDVEDVLQTIRDKPRPPLDLPDSP